MKTSAPAYLELPVRLHAVPARVLNPFHWALLKALVSFPAGIRPELGVFTSRLAIGDPRVLEEAWNDLCALKVVDSATFQQARLTLEGEQALTEGFFALGPVEARELWLGVERLGAETTVSILLRPGAGTPGSGKPAWSESLDRTLLEEALASPGGLSPLERLLDYRLDWARALIRTS